MALRTKIIDFIGLYFGNNAGEVTAVGQVAVMQHKVTMIDMRILIEMIYPLGIQTTGPAFYTVYFVTFFKKKFRQIRSILAGNSGYKRNLHWM
jgi:hypothetical protein